MGLSELELTTSEKLLVFLEMCLDVSEPVNERVVLQNAEVFHMEVSLVVSSELLVGLSGVDTLQDANASEVLERQLHAADGVGPGEVLGSLSLGSFLNLSSHFD